MKRVLLNAMFLLFALIVGMSNVWAIENYSRNYYKNNLANNMFSGNYAPNDCDPYYDSDCGLDPRSNVIDAPASPNNPAYITIPINHQPVSDVTITFQIGVIGTTGHGGSYNPTFSNSTVTAVGTETGSNWSGSGLSQYPIAGDASPSTPINSVLTLVKPANPTRLGGIRITLNVGTDVRIFAIYSMQVQYQYYNPSSITLNAACTDAGKYYATYSSDYAFFVPSDLTVSEISVAGGNLSVSDYATGAVVPAGTGVLVSSTSSGEHAITLTTGGTSVLGSDNMLKSSGDAGITAASMTVADTKFYRLTMHNGSQIGFYWGAENGAAFDLGANKAYLAVPDEQAGLAPMRFWLDEEEDNATDIETIEANGKAVKFIENGRLVIKRDGIRYDALGRIVK